MSSRIQILNYLSKFWQVGPKEYLRQLNRIGDTKVGTLIGQDSFGNKYYENLQDEIIMRTRWVEFNNWYANMDRVEPGWRAWLTYTVDSAPNNLSKEHQAIQAVPKLPPKLIKSQTGTPGMYVPYSTVRPHIERWSWEPVAKTRA